MGVPGCSRDQPGNLVLVQRGRGCQLCLGLSRSAVTPHTTGVSPEYQGENRASFVSSG